MKQYQRITCILLCLLLTGCGTAQSSSDTAEQSASETSADAAGETAPAETDAPETKPETPIYDYVHGEDGYFSLVDEGFGTPVKLQGGRHLLGRFRGNRDRIQCIGNARRNNYG